MKLELACGDSIVALNAPNMKRVFEIVEPTPCGSGDDKREVLRALSNPIGTKRLSEIVAKGKKVAVIFDDHTRPTPVSMIAPLVLDELLASGVRPEDITFVMATGTHPSSFEAAKRKLGPELFAKYRVVVHDILDEANMVFCGITSYATPVWINRAVEEADVKIGIGHIAPHDRVGYSGGAKIILPGVSARETIDHNHILYIAPQSRLFVIEGNPLRADMEEAAKLAGLDFIVNVILNDRGEVVHAVAGDPIKAHREGVRLWEKAYRVEIPERADIAIVSPGKNDRYLFHVLEGVIIGDVLTKENGSIIIMGSCRGGWAPDSGYYLNFFDRSYAPKSLMRLGLEDIYRIIVDRKLPMTRMASYVFQFKRVIHDKNVILVSEGFPSDEIQSFGMTPATSLDEAVSIALKRHGGEATFAVSRGGKFFPVFVNAHRKALSHCS